MDKHLALSPCPFCGMGLTLDIDDDGGVAILHSLKGEKDCYFPSVVEIEMPVGTTLDEMAEIINRRPIQESFEHALVGASLVAVARLQDKDFEIQDLTAELARLREQEINYENDIFLGQPIEYWMRIKAQLDADNSDSYVREVLLLKAELARRDEIIKRLREDAERLAIVETEMTGYEDEYEEVYCLHSGSCGSRKYQKGVEFIHTPNCPITLHRALMKELE